MSRFYAGGGDYRANEKALCVIIEETMPNRRDILGAKTNGYRRKKPNNLRKRDPPP